MTAVRSSEARGARWSEVDLDAKTWTIPAERMKGSRADHTVPLSTAALDVMKQARTLSRGKGLIFPSAKGTAIQDAVLTRLLRDLDVTGTMHGFRTSFRSWAAECTDFPREICELSLGHVAGSQVERAYMRSDLLEKRRELMQAWSDYIS